MAKGKGIVGDCTTTGNYTRQFCQEILTYTTKKKKEGDRKEFWRTQKWGERGRRREGTGWATVRRGVGDGRDTETNTVGKGGLYNYRSIRAESRP